MVLFTFQRLKLEYFELTEFHGLLLYDQRPKVQGLVPVQRYLAILVRVQRLFHLRPLYLPGKIWKNWSQVTVKKYSDHPNTGHPITGTKWLSEPNDYRNQMIIGTIWLPDIFVISNWMAMSIQLPHRL